MQRTTVRFPVSGSSGADGQIRTDEVFRLLLTRQVHSATMRHQHIMRGINSQETRKLSIK